MTQFWHNLTAWNSTGEGIHSPYLFSLVRFALHSEGQFYAWQTLLPTREERVLFRLLNRLHQEGIVHVTVPTERLKTVLMSVDSHMRVSVKLGSRAHIEMVNPIKNVTIIWDDALPEDWTSVFDYGAFRIVFHDPHYLKRIYKMRL